MFVDPMHRGERGRCPANIFYEVFMVEWIRGPNIGTRVMGLNPTSVPVEGFSA